MGSFANGLFSLLLGWLQSVVSFLWAALSGNRGSAALSWLYEHWLLLAVLLCVFGGTADLIVYLIRWRPIQVWRSFFRRMRMRKSEPELPGESGEEWETSLQDTPSPYSEEEAERVRRRAALEEETQLAASHRESAEASLRRSRRRGIASPLFTENGQRSGLSAAPQEVFNTQDTYHKPIYPRKWRTGARQDGTADE